MMRTSVTFFTVLSLSLVMFAAPVLAQEADQERTREQAQQAKMEKIRDRVQMPIAVDKAVKAGARQNHVRTMAKELVEGDVEGKEFNETMRHGPAISQNMEAEDDGDGNGKGLGEFVKQKKNEGLRGKELANAIHAELNRRGIPAGKKGARGQGKSPVDGDFIPPGQQKQMDRGQSQRQKRNQPAQEETHGQSDEARGKDSRMESDRNKSRSGQSNRDNEKAKSRSDQSDQRSRSKGPNNQGKGRR